MNIGGKLFATFLPSLVTLGTVGWTSLAHLSSVQDPAQVADQQATIEALEKAEGHGTTYRDVASADEAAGSRTIDRILSEAQVAVYRVEEKSNLKNV